MEADINIAHQTMADHEGNEYFLHDRIGQGGFGDVYRAWDRDRRVYVALKVIKFAKLVENAEKATRLAKQFVDMFGFEVANTVRLNHPNILRLFTLIEVDPSLPLPFFVMELLEGSDAESRLRKQRGPLATDQAINIMGQVAPALSFAHDRGLVHLDIKPANIFTCDNNRVVLMDFGLANLTSANSRGGTPAYMAPEQIEGQTVDSRTDVYGLGVTIFQILAGRLPFVGDHGQGKNLAEKIIYEHLHIPAPHLYSYNTKVPRELSGVLQIAMSKDKRKRYQTIDDFHAAFDQAMDGQNPPEPAPQPSPRPGTNHKRPSKHMGQPNFVVRAGQYAGKRITIPEGTIHIGRGEDNDLHLVAKSVSRNQAIVTRQRKDVTIRDVSQRETTLVNGQPITRHTLQDGDQVMLGKTEKLIYYED